MSDEFKKIAKREIEDFKNEYRTRFPGANADAITDEDLMREVMNTVGKPGKGLPSVQNVMVLRSTLKRMIYGIAMDMTYT